VPNIIEIDPPPKLTRIRLYCVCEGEDWLCEDWLLQYRYDQVWIIVKRWKQSPVSWFLESFYSNPRAFHCWC